MHSIIRLLTKPFRIVTHRLRTQGVKRTLMWLWGRGLPRLTGRLVLDHSQITPQLYVGPQHGKIGKRQLEAAEINGCVNMRVEFDDAAYGLELAEYCYLPTVDETPPALDDLRKGAAFMTRVIDAGGKVYVHCAGGVGRAPTMAAAYLITQGMSLDDAIALIQRGRPYVDVLPDQYARLREFEAAYRNNDPTAPGDA